MREIKFRGLTPKDEWIIGDLAKLMHENNLCIMPKSYFGTRDFGEEDEKGNPIIQNELAIGGFISVVKETVGQFTGLKDKNGKEIYEGDIIRYPTLYETPEMCNTEYSNDIIVFENGGFYLGQYNEETLLYCEMISYDGNFEVIGNIHENPELLNA